MVNSPASTLQLHGLISSSWNSLPGAPESEDEEAEQSTTPFDIQKNSPSSSGARLPFRTTKRVQFSSKVRARMHISLDDMTPQEIQDAWLIKEESKAILKSCGKLIRLMDQQQDPQQRGSSRLTKSGKKYCIRGLESQARLASLAKRNNRQDAYNAVLDEQERQEEVWQRSASPSNSTLYLDAEAIRALYHPISSSCQLWAHLIGLKDQREAELILNDYPAKISTRSNDMSLAATPPVSYVKTSSHSISSIQKDHPSPPCCRVVGTAA